MEQLADKHPEAQQAKLGSVLFGRVEDVPAILYQQINGEMVRETALTTKSCCGPSGVDANGYKRMLASKSFKKSNMNLCDSLATLARRLLIPSLLSQVWLVGLFHLIKAMGTLGLSV